MESATECHGLLGKNGSREDFHWCHNPRDGSSIALHRKKVPVLISLRGPTLSQNISSVPYRLNDSLTQSYSNMGSSFETHWVKPILPTVLGDQKSIPLPATDHNFYPVRTTRRCAKA